MKDVSGDFEIHITVHAHDAAALEDFAGRHGVTFLHIVLDRGFYASQPMLTFTGRGTLREQLATVGQWQARMQADGLHPIRAKVEAAPWNAGVPERDADARREPGHRYFEHHVKLLLPDASLRRLKDITDLVTPHGARLSRNARRRRDDGAEERFVNQRCHAVGRLTAQHRLEKLTAALRAAGHEVVKAEQEYVVVDSDLDHDQGWLAESTSADTKVGRAPRKSGSYPATYQPLPRTGAIEQTAPFDPALKHHDNAYRAGEPVFVVRGEGERWRAARQEAISRILTGIAGSRWAANLVLRGSVAMAAWVGASAREPGDLDFVVTPAGTDRDALIDGIAAIGGRPAETTRSPIWTYERADGIRLMIPFEAPAAVPGHVQVDVVFGEELPLPPEPITLPGVGVPVLAASAGLSLAWKLLWLATDMYPQGKDLYDAVLLAEHTTTDLDLVRDLMRPELGAEADLFTPESVLAWTVDWPNFTAEYPAVPGTRDDWLWRLAIALDQT